MKKISKEESDEICGLFDNIQLRANKVGGDVSNFIALLNSFAINGQNMTPEEQMIMIDEWMNVEDNSIVLDDEIEDDLARLDGSINEVDDNNNNDDDNDGDAANNNDDNGMDLDDDLILVVQKPQPQSKLSLREAEEMIKELREYVETIGAPPENANMLLRIGRNIRAYNGAKRRQQISMVPFLKNKNNSK